MLLNSKQVICLHSSLTYVSLVSIFFTFRVPIFKSFSPDMSPLRLCFWLKKDDSFIFLMYSGLGSVRGSVSLLFPWQGLSQSHVLC